jgi:hypothetical protein
MLQFAGRHRSLVRRPASARALAVGAFIATAFLALTALSVWFLWQPLFHQLRAGHSLESSIKNWYLSDQLTYMGIIRNVQDGKSAYIEPLTSTGWSIYPSGYYWLLGIFARATDTNPLFAWNVVGIGFAVALAVTAGAWGRWATRSNWGWLVGPIPAMLGTLQWWTNDSYKQAFGDHGVLWPPFVIIFNPAAETPGLILIALAMLCTAKALACSDGQLDLRWMIGAGALGGLCMNVHTYPTLFGFTAIAIALLVDQLLKPLPRKALPVVIGAILASWALVLSGVLTAALGLLAVVIIGVLAPLVLVAEWRKRTLVPLISFFGIAGVMAAPILARIVADVRKPDSFLAWRQSIAQDDDLSLPVGHVLFQAAPILLIAVVAVCVLVGRRERAHDRAWAAVAIGTIVSSALLTFNAAWGMNQEPYRFFPYAMLMISIVTLPWLLTNLASRRAVLGRVVLACMLLPTVPTSVAFARGTADANLHFSDGEMAAYHVVGDNLPPGITLVDVCLPRRAFKALTHANVADFNAGLALPAHREALRKVLDDQGKGILSSDKELRAAGITSFVTMNYCAGLSDAALQQRFGPALTRYTPTDTATCNMPSNTAFSAYAVGDEARNGPTAVPDFDPANARRFRNAPGSAYPPEGSSNCGYGFNTD